MPTPRPTPGASHHARISREMRQWIVDGTWPPGHALARETDLAQRYGVSRMTMNKVLTQLTAEGYLVRRKRSGTFVAQPRGQSAVMEINDIAQEVAALGWPYDWHLTTHMHRPLTEAEAAMLDMAPGDQAGHALYLEGTHMGRATPFCLEQRAIHLAAVPQAGAQDFAVVVPGQWLLRTMPFSTASHRVRAINATLRDARSLAVPPGTACLEVLRKTRIDQTWVTHVRLLYPGEAHQLMADFAPGLGLGGSNGAG